MGKSKICVIKDFVEKKSSRYPMHFCKNPFGLACHIVTGLFLLRKQTAHFNTFEAKIEVKKVRKYCQKCYFSSTEERYSFRK